MADSEVEVVSAVAVAVAVMAVAVAVMVEVADKQLNYLKLFLFNMYIKKKVWKSSTHSSHIQRAPHVA
jgi:hypothetical protein